MGRGSAPAGRSVITSKSASTETQWTVGEYQNPSVLRGRRRGDGQECLRHMPERLTVVAGPDGMAPRRRSPRTACRHSATDERSPTGPPSLRCRRTRRAAVRPARGPSSDQHRQMRGHIEIRSRSALDRRTPVPRPPTLLPQPGRWYRLVASEDALEHRAVAQPHVVGAEILDLLAALGECRRALPGIGVSGQDQAVGASWFGCRECRCAQRARMIRQGNGIASLRSPSAMTAAAAFKSSTRWQYLNCHRWLRICHSLRDPVVQTSKPIAGKNIHGRVFAAVGHREIETRSCRHR